MRVRLLVPKRAVPGLRRLANALESDVPIQIAKDESHLFFSAGDSVLIARSISGQFPDYEGVLPKANANKATVDAAALRESLRRVALLAPEQTRAVCLALETGRLALSASGTDTGEATESLDVSYSGEPIRVTFNSVYLLDLLAVVRSGAIELALKDGASAAEMRPVDPGEYRYRYIVMPMRL